MARGGMGTVWLGRDEKLGRPVAVKVMSQDLAGMHEARQRFEREALAAAQLRSNHIVEVYDYGIQEGLPYIVMELLEGENLTQRLKRVGRLSIHEAAEVLRQIGRGLMSAHRAGLIHRDLKPSNIFLAERDGQQTVKLLDFGVVKAMDIDGLSAEEATQSGMLLGTPQYMSPEQARGTRELDPRSDVWSAGVILFRMLTGTNPFKGESVGDIVLKICSDELPRITDVLPSLPGALDPFFDKAFSRDPAGRFQSAQELVEAFNQVIVAEGMAAPVPFGGGGELSRSGMGHSRPSFEAPLSPQARANMPMARGTSPSQITPGAGVPQPYPSMPTPTSGSIPSGSMPSGSLTPQPVLNSESTPISTTVAGTPMASNWPRPRKPQGAQSVALVVAGAATLITGALVAAIWLGSSPAETAVPTEPAARADVDLFSNDDDGGPSEEEPVDERADGEESEEGGEAEEGEEQDEATPGADAEGAGGAAPAASASASASSVPPRPPIVPRPLPKSGRKKPDWGLSGNN